MRWLIETIGGLLELARLGGRSGFRFRGPYWQWRLETAFGGDRSAWPPRRQRVLAMLEYARWVFKMRRSL